MIFYELDPLKDSRWERFLQRHPRASAFHSVAWLEALHRTYGYKPVVLSTSKSEEEIQSAIVFCEVESWLTGRRLVSLPFADHCEPLVGNDDELQAMLLYLENKRAEEGWKYVDVRPRNQHRFENTHFEKSEHFHFHALDLGPKSEAIFNAFHKDSIQRKIRRAEREGVKHQEGQSELLLEKFYRLLLVTRRRHQLPPHPLDWFKNLLACMGDSLKIRIASKDGRPIASILTLSYKDSTIYKYGCSDEKFHNLGGMPLLLWAAIEDARNIGYREFDWGRSDWENSGLVSFKDKWGAARSELTYLRFPGRVASAARGGWKLQVAKRFFEWMPDRFLTAMGRMLYRHIG